MSNCVVLGAQWGDEGKGKIVDLLAKSADWVARYAGGANAGHTVKVGDTRFALHLVPTGILSPQARCLIGHGVVLDLPALFSEMDSLVKADIKVEDRLFVASATHLVLPHHKLLEEQAEECSSDAEKIGTTMRGIGPAYADKIARRGVRAGDLLDQDRLVRSVRQAIDYWDRITNGLLTSKGCTAESVVQQLQRCVARLTPMIVDGPRLLNDAIRQGQSILYEGAQGTLLDIDFGTYPYVTSSSTTVGGACTGLGIPPSAIGRVIGVVKAYTTRVGNGPFPTEALNDDGKRLQTGGNEFGTTTGRCRRCGWLDLVALKYAVRVNGITHVAITKLDVLDEFDEIPVCVAYDHRGERSTEVPLDGARLGEVKPVYRMMPGWKQPTAGMTDCADLPPAAKDYVKFVCGTLGVKMLMISTGPERDETIICGQNAELVAV
jgi:adenylosuccinate synthase